MNRKTFLHQSTFASAAALLAPYILKATGKADPTILIVSGWQDVNIGDIAHTPGLIGLLRKRLPKAKLILWKKSNSKLVDDLLKQYYPSLNYVTATVDKEYNPSNDGLKEAFKNADILIHGSGSGLVAPDFVETWRKHTGKPYGTFGISITGLSPLIKSLLEKASFIFTRETGSIELLKKAGIAGDHIAFAPDATWDLEMHDEKKASAFMKANKLEHKKFICVIPRLRITPYYQFKAGVTWTPERIKEVTELNESKKEPDHAKARAAMIAWVKKTRNKIVVCPEMTYQVGIMDELLINPLPDDVKPFVVKHEYWLPDEAASLYAHAHTVLSFECHSPIIASVNGTPAFYLRQPEDTIKGQMYYDLGLSDYVFEIEKTTGEQIADRLLEVTNDYPKAQQKVKDAMSQVKLRYDHAFSIINKLDYNIT